METVKLYVIVEGVTDLKFLSDFLNRHYGLSFGNASKTEIEYRSPEKTILLRTLAKDGGSGWAAILNNNIQASIKQLNEEGYRCLVLLDTDNVNHPHGGFEKRYERVLSLQKNDPAVAFELFLLPDNRSDGDLETLLVEIVPEEGKNAMECLKKYRECLLACANETPDLKVMDLKKIVYTMYPNLYGLDYGRGKWDFDHPLLSPLKTFFDKYLNGSTPS